MGDQPEIATRTEALEMLTAKAREGELRAMIALEEALRVEPALTTSSNGSSTARSSFTSVDRVGVARNRRRPLVKNRIASARGYR
jgi:hypothetical protein